MEPEEPLPVPALLFHERTALAWSRAGLAIVAIGALVVRLAVQAGATVLGLVAAAVLFALAGAVWRLGEHEVDVRHRRLALLPAAVVISAVTAFVLALLG
jgi:uncharacterized membrane protein YidH (DUF202 family)